MLAFDLAAPLATIVGLLAIGVVLGWPLWWVSACSVLMVLAVEGVAINIALWRRDSVTVGTDDDRPVLRLAVVGLCTAALVAAVLTGYTRWTTPDRNLKQDAIDVVRVATAMAEATATFTPQHPAASMDRAAAMMEPDQAMAFKDQFARATADLARRNVSAQARTLAAGVEAIGPSAASVAVVLSSTRNAAGQEPSRTVLSLRVTLTKQGERWLVRGVSPINAR